MEEYIVKTLAPKLRGDGGWVEFESYENGKLTLVFRGECSKCLILHRCIAWMEKEILRDTGEEVHIEAVRKKPYFWDMA